MPLTRAQTVTIDHLYEELMYMIFDYLPFKDKLNCSLVCRHWADLVKNNAKFMRRLKLNIEYVRTNHPRPFTRHYNDVRFNNVRFYVLDQNLRKLISLAERIEIYNCTLPDMVTLRRITSWCRYTRVIIFDQLFFGKLDMTRKQQLEHPWNDTNRQFLQILVKNTSWKVLECFDLFFHLRVDYINRNPSYPQDLLYILGKFGHILDELTLSGDWQTFERPLRRLRASKTVKLITLKLESEIQSKTILALVRQILMKQQPTLTTLEVRDIPIEDVNWMAENMLNLEKFACSVRALKGPNLSRLQKLRILTLRLRDLNCELDLADLSLEELIIKGYRIRTKFSIVSPAKPMTSLKRLEISFIKLKPHNVQQICQLMPNLDTLDVSFDSRSFDAPDQKKYIFGPQLNQLVHLTELNLDIIYFNSDFLQKLVLPNLYSLGVTVIHSWDFLQIMTPDRMSRSDLNALAANCQSLEFIEKIYYDERRVIAERLAKNRIIYWKRLRAVKEVTPCEDEYYY